MKWLRQETWRNLPTATQCTGGESGGQAPAPHPNSAEGKTDKNVPILEIRKLRQGLVQGHTAKSGQLVWIHTTSHR